jgi:hypothetical protein
MNPKNNRISGQVPRNPMMDLASLSARNSTGMPNTGPPGEGSEGPGHRLLGLTQSRENTVIQIRPTRAGAHRAPARARRISSTVFSRLCGKPANGLPDRIRPSEHSRVLNRRSRRASDRRIFRKYS